MNVVGLKSRLVFRRVYVRGSRIIFVGSEIESQNMA